MRLSDEHLRRFDRDGFVLIEGFLEPAECAAARAAFFACCAPPYDAWVASGRKEAPFVCRQFPWNDATLDGIAVHPRILDAAERIAGTRALRLADASALMKYAGRSYWEAFHEDYANNTLGPPLPRDRSNLVFFIFIDDVREGMAPILMVPDGRLDAEAVPILAPAGSVCIYSAISTRHSASSFTAPHGHRAVLSVCLSRADRPWDGGRTFTQKGGCDAEALGRFIAGTTPRGRELIGFPPPGDELWSDAFLAGMAARYPGFDPAPYIAARESAMVPAG